jgi:hypothetical protein
MQASLIILMSFRGLTTESRLDPAIKSRDDK